MLHEDDLPLLFGPDPQEIGAAQRMRLSCLRIAQHTGRQMATLVAHKRMSLGEYHHRAHAIRICFALHRQASWWLRPYHAIEHDLYTYFRYFARARLTDAATHPTFVFPQDLAAFACWVYEQCPGERIASYTPCTRCGQSLLVQLGLPQEQRWCVMCLPTTPCAQTTTVSMPTLRTVPAPLAPLPERSRRTLWDYARMAV